MSEQECINQRAHLASVPNENVMIFLYAQILSSLQGAATVYIGKYEMCKGLSLRAFRLEIFRNFHKGSMLPICKPSVTTSKRGAS